MSTLALIHTAQELAELVDQLIQDVIAVAKDGAEWRDVHQLPQDEEDDVHSLCLSLPLSWPHNCFFLNFFFNSL